MIEIERMFEDIFRRHLEKEDEYQQQRGVVWKPLWEDWLAKILVSHAGQISASRKLNIWSNLMKVLVRFQLIFLNIRIKVYCISRSFAEQALSKTRWIFGPCRCLLI